MDVVGEERHPRHRRRSDPRRQCREVVLLPLGDRTEVGEVAGQVAEPLGHRLVAGFAYQLAVVFAAFLSAKALGLPVSWTAVLAFMPAVAIVQVLPAPTIGGLGVREGAFVLFLHPLGVSADQAITLGLLVYGINLVASLFGAPAFAVGNRSHAVPSVRSA